MMENVTEEQPEDVGSAEYAAIEDALRRQDEALALLERLRHSEPRQASQASLPVGGRREGRRWPKPEGVTISLHSGQSWQAAELNDLGIGGGRLGEVPGWMVGPTPIRFAAPSGPAVLALADFMWRDGAKSAGLRFEFLDPEERDRWAAMLLDALLAEYALN